MSGFTLFIVLFATFTFGLVFPLIHYKFTNSGISKHVTKDNPNKCTGTHDWYKRDRVCKKCGYHAKTDTYLSEQVLANYKMLDELADKKEESIREKKLELSSITGVSLSNIDLIQKELEKASEDFSKLALKEIKKHV